MSTTALVGNGVNYPGINGEARVLPRTGMFPRRPDVRQIVREELERQKRLEELEQKYNNGEISKFEYYVNKTMLSMPLPPVIYSKAPTVEYMA